MTQKIALVTGAARGIGLATAKLFIEQGWKVAMIDRDGEELATASKTLSNAAPFEHDVSDPDQVNAMIKAVLAAFGRIDAVVNNAGVADFLPIEETSFATWRTIMQTNLDGVFLVSQAAIPALKETRGAIVNIGSISGLRDPSRRLWHIKGRSHSHDQTTGRRTWRIWHSRQLRLPRPGQNQTGDGGAFA